MAKQCSSKTPIRSDLAPLSPVPGLPARTWEDRLFKNTYVRAGRSKQVKGWAVRFQFQGIRKTFSFKPEDRRAAAAEAREIHHALLTQGWEAAVQLHRLRRLPQSLSIPNDSGLAKQDVAYWKPRLIRRKYTEPLQPGSSRALSVRIGDETTQYWFPLGTEVEEPAAARALEIHRTLESAGWRSVCAKFSREITVAIFWAVSPVAVTYTTIYTLVGSDPPMPIPIPVGRKPRRTVAVVESDPGIQKALAFWLDRQPGVKCALAAHDIDGIIDATGGNRPDLLLFNRALPAAGELIQKLKSQVPNLPIFAYDVSEHIDQIFTSLTGVMAGYIFRRRVPSELLEPVRGALRQQNFSADEVAQHIRNYFGNLFEPGLPVGGSPLIANLTSRELEVLNLLSKGSVDKEIAEVLRISVWTVHSHLKKIYDKLQVHTRTEAVLKYLEK